MWCKTVNDFDFISPNGGEQTWTADCTGYYKLEVWGASGGDANEQNGGYGGYAIGVAKMSKGSKYYVNIGGQGDSETGCNVTAKGGYNGGGDGYRNASMFQCDLTYYTGGGGATHIAMDSGALRTLSAHKTDGRIFIVAGGGGGAHYYGKTSDGNASTGGSGGGYHGGAGTQDWASHVCKSWKCTLPTVSTQTVAGDIGYHIGSDGTESIAVEAAGFGYGSTTNNNAQTSGGGGGYYGGAAGGQIYANGGSGYIGSSNLISSSTITKHMTCYSCDTSSDANTKTNSNTTAPKEVATADVAKMGNGYAKITYLGTSI